VLQVALEHHHVAGAQFDRAQPLGEALAPAADGEQVHPVALVELQALGRMVDEERPGADDGLDDADLVGGLVGGDLPVLAGELEAGAGHHALERRRIALQHHGVVLADHRVGKRLGAAVVGADDGGDLHLLFGELVDVGDGLADDLGFRP
jgi:hypothetical protein